MPKRKLRTQIAFWAGICLVATVGIVVVVSASMTHATASKAAVDQALTTSKGEAALARTELEQALNSARTIAQMLAGVKDPSAVIMIGREEVKGILGALVEKNADFVGVFSCWEPNQFDSMDAQNVQRPGSDAAGRFSPYWRRNEQGGTGLASVLGLPTHAVNGVPGAWYDVPRKTRQEFISEPYAETVNGRTRLVASLVAPIMVGDTFFGVVGVDLDLGFLARRVAEISVFDRTGRMICVTNAGTVVALSGNASAAGRSLATVDPAWQNLASQVRTGGAVSEPVGGDLAVFTPLQPGHTATPWSVGILVPNGKIRQQAFALLFTQIPVSLLCIGAALGLLWVTAGRLTSSIAQATGDLSKIAGSVSRASSDAAQASQTIAAGASRQAASIEETSASLEEMAAMTRRNAENARQANRMTNEARDSAARGLVAMTQMGEAIQRMKKSSDESARIVRTIDEIAFQTNILALNAAVEAARAGASGMGFAVVADEVRSLAQRSAEAAKTTAMLIEGAQTNAEAGVSSSTEVAAILERIVENVQKATDLVSEVTKASLEQTEGIEQITRAVAEVDKVVQSNAAVSDESLSSSRRLEGETHDLHQLVAALTGIVSGTRQEGMETKRTATPSRSLAGRAGAAT